MTLKEFVRAESRMCNYKCQKCPVSSQNNGNLGVSCHGLKRDYPDKYIAAVTKWAAEHPEPHKKTYAEDFFEKFPNAARVDEENPLVCRQNVYSGPSPCAYGKSCKDCWDEPV
jgi:hypothetical protein